MPNWNINPMKLYVLIAFHFPLVFAFVSDDVCFTLDLRYICEEYDQNNRCSNGEYFYNLYKTPESVQVNLFCQADEFAVIDSIRYSIPYSRSNFQSRTDYSSYCVDKTSNGPIACTESACQCCTKPSWHSDICNHTLQSDQTRQWRDYCIHSLGVCSVNVPRYDFYYLSTSTDERMCLDYSNDCHYNGTSWCYARWASVNYHCQKATTTTTTSTTHTTIPTQTTTTSSLTSTPPVTTTPASQSSTVSISADPGSPLMSTTLTLPGAGSTEANTAASSAGINIGLVAGLSVGAVLIIIGAVAGVTLLIIHRKKQRTQDRNSAAGSVYYNVSPSTQPQQGHNTATKIPPKKPQAGNTDTYEEGTVQNNAESLSPEAIQCDYYNIRGINDWNEVERSVYQMPVQDGNEIRESGNTGDVYQQLDNTANGTIADTTAAVDYENLAISSDYITVD